MNETGVAILIVAWTVFISYGFGFESGRRRARKDHERILREIDQTLRVPAAEYVPAIGDVFQIIDGEIKVEKP